MTQVSLSFWRYFPFLGFIAQDFDQHQISRNNGLSTGLEGGVYLFIFSTPAGRFTNTRRRVLFSQPPLSKLCPSPFKEKIICIIFISYPSHSNQTQYNQSHLLWPALQVGVSVILIHGVCVLVTRSVSLLACSVSTRVPFSLILLFPNNDHPVDPACLLNHHPMGFFV